MNALEEHVACILRVEEWAKQKNQRQSRLYLPPALKLVSCLAYSSDPQDGGDMFLRNVG
jgi:hypothetical protein